MGRVVRIGAIASLMGLSVAVAPAAGAGGAVRSDAPGTVVVVARNLNNPRGLTFDAAGRLYVAEAGRGGKGRCVPGEAPGDPPSCFGFSASLTQVSRGRQRRILAGLPSLGDKGTGSNAGGLSDVAVRSDGRLVLVEQGGGTPESRAAFGRRAWSMGHLLILDPRTHRLRAGVDLETFEVAQNPDGGEIDSDPYSVLIDGNDVLVADAGGNDVVRVGQGGVGHRSLVTVQQPRSVDAPPALGAPAGTQLPMQWVPDSLTRGPDGSVYVGELTGFPFVVGAARVSKIVGNATQTVASGFTNVIDLAFGPDGSLYVLEIAHTGLLDDNAAGGLFRVNPDGSSALIVGGLDHPGGLTIHDGSAYISNHGTRAGVGEVDRVAL